MTTTTEKKVKHLTTRQKQYLKGLAHPLPQLVQIGKEGLNNGLIETTKRELLNHELIKIKIASNSGLEKRDTAESLAKMTDSTLVQLIGKTIVLYKENPKRPKEKKILLPKN
ncbi:ribosome assembly RNA-binding protein YhbY [Desulforhopalus singaporensis]|uniref:RNA-binding protein n=1 Tax=Desulforhopalus singaporensis TaxID=91360 RepID=A0A1H0J9L5_9BACT|nr:ribosome assembly RNA-binding protein YhbY [Desulforhopalus singaporensis]SDO40455.1 RNA-binding protein [Desulforhopalus singaporensis]